MEGDLGWRDHIITPHWALISQILDQKLVDIMFPVCQCVCTSRLHSQSRPRQQTWRCMVTSHGTYWNGIHTKCSVNASMCPTPTLSKFKWFSVFNPYPIKHKCLNVPIPALNKCKCFIVPNHYHMSNCKCFNGPWPYPDWGWVNVNGSTCPTPTLIKCICFNVSNQYPE